MSIASLVRDLIAAGASSEIIAIAVEAVEAAQTAAPPRARSSSAERMARKRERDAVSHVTGEGVTCDAKCDAQGDAGDDRRAASDATGDASGLPRPPSPQTPQPPTPTRDGVTPRAHEDDWPEGLAKDHAGDLAKLNPNIDLARRSGLVTTIGEIARWRQLGFSWPLDVLPVIEAHAARPRGDPVASWKFFTDAISRAHAARTRPADPTAPQGPHERPIAPTDKFDAKLRNLADAASVRPAQRGTFIG